MARSDWPQGHPRCGDVWRLPDGRHLLVDYKSSLQTGLTYDDGERRGCYYTDTFESLLGYGFYQQAKATLVSRFEDRPFPWCDAKGWSREEDKPTLQDSLNFLQAVLAGDYIRPRVLSLCEDIQLIDAEC
jgi:hypothetical protein